MRESYFIYDIYYTGKRSEEFIKSINIYFIQIADWNSDLFNYNILLF